MLWDKGHVVDLDDSCESETLPVEINANGQILWNAHAGGIFRPLLWENGHRTDIELPVLGTYPEIEADRSYAADLNDRGDVVGTINYDVDYVQGFLWREGTVTLLGSQGVSSAIAINNRGQILLGAGSLYGQPSRLFLWEDGSTTDQGVGVAGFGPYQPGSHSLNDRGQVVGAFPTGIGVRNGGEQIHAFLWELGGPLHLRLLLPFATLILSRVEAQRGTIGSAGGASRMLDFVWQQIVGAAGVDPPPQSFPNLTELARDDHLASIGRLGQ